MEQYWLRKEGNQDLLLYMLGWAATPNAINHICPEGYDVLAVCNYTRLTPLSEAELGSYHRIYLFAWSFGIWVAEQTCRELPLHKAIALNGTPYPVDARYGMRLRVVLRTMRNLAHNGGINTAAEQQDDSRYMPTGPFPDRDPMDKIVELENLAAWSKEQPGIGLHWDKAYIADKDEIFPPANMWAYWEPMGLGTSFSSYHYPFAQPDIVLNELKD
ncbi:MAG: DUF452 family protein [Akkermansia sp.]|nr:DUF452 family protein [Akkermansia sp.]